jgi:hypothetical protein
MAFQTPLPMAVNSVNCPNGMWLAPAGMDTRLRTTGTHRPRSTALFS